MACPGHRETVYGLWSRTELETGKWGMDLLERGDGVGTKRCGLVKTYGVEVER